ncbi:MAG: hypothetical protein KDK91_29975, partial [Gammaproteobacteria bacterium]|nr:hypothetical protein [Gammaproteobacteria bacterium]
NSHSPHAENSAMQIDPIRIDGRRPTRGRTRAGLIGAVLLGACSFGPLAQAAGDTSDAGGATMPRCLYVSSYHSGYAWSDGVERGLRSVITDQCELRQVDMDTKRNKDKDYKVAKALEIKGLIETWKPDVVITSDDNAAKFLIAPHFKDSSIPFVFCGVNWSAEEYGFPTRNITGMIEIAPIRPMLRSAIGMSKSTGRALYIGADTLTEKKNYNRFAEAAPEFNLSVQSRLVSTSDEWIEAYEAGQRYDFIIIGSNSGIEDWDADRVAAAVAEKARVLSVTNHDWMMPFTMVGFNKVAEEQGEWAANTALEILRGTPPASIAMTQNRRWDISLNQPLLAVTELRVPKSLASRARPYGG